MLFRFNSLSYSVYSFEISLINKSYPENCLLAEANIPLKAEDKFNITIIIAIDITTNFVLDISNLLFPIFFAAIISGPLLFFLAIRHIIMIIIKENGYAQEEQRKQNIM